jgi:hypothetical protein
MDCDDCTASTDAWLEPGQNCHRRIPDRLPQFACNMLACATCRSDCVSGCGTMMLTAR